MTTTMPGRLNPTASEAGLTDEAIVERVRKGHETHLFELLMRRNNQRIYRAARAILKDDREAEDVMQDAYVRAYAHLSDFDGRARFSTWLTKIAVHEALARVRKSKRTAQPETDEVTSVSSPERNAANSEMRGILEHAIGELPDEFREVFVLRAVEELSGAETAEVLGIPEDTVKTRLHRARMRLQASLLAQAEVGFADTFTFEAPRCDRVVLAVFARIRSVQ